jgi:hypothetical protein
VLVLRVWREPGACDLRARITETRDVSQPGTTTAVAGSADEISALVKDWIDEFEHGSGVPVRGPS